MKKRKLGLAILAGALALLAAGYFFAAHAKSKKIQESAVNYERIAVVSLDPEEIVSLKVPAEGLALEKQGDQWTLVRAGNGAAVKDVKLDQSEINYRVRSLAGMSAEELIGEVPQGSAELADYGLDAPRGRIILVNKDGAETEIDAGNLTPSKSSYYVMTSGGQEVYTVSRYNADNIFLSLNSIRDKTLFPSFEIDALKRLVIQPENWRIEIVPKDESLVQISQFDPYMMTGYYQLPRGADTEKLQALLEALSRLKVSEYIDGSPPSLAPYGLDKPRRIRLETAEAALELLVGGEAGDAVYARLPDSPEVFTLSGLSVVTSATPFGLLDKFALILNIDTVDSLTVAGEGGNFTGTIEHKEEDSIYRFNGRQAEEKSFKAWYQAVIGLLIEAELPGKTYAQGDPGLRIDYVLNKAPFKTGIALLPYNRDFYVLEYEGTTEFLISRGQVKKIFDAAEAMVYTD